MLKYFSLLILLFFFAACNTETEAGGPCTYEYDTIPARVTAINTIDSIHCNLLFVLDKKNAAANDSISYYSETDRWLPLTELKEKNIAVNDTFIFIKGTIKTGSCTPADNRLLLERFRKQ